MRRIGVRATGVVVLVAGFLAVGCTSRAAPLVGSVPVASVSTSSAPSSSISAGSVPGAANSLPGGASSSAGQTPSASINAASNKRRADQEASWLLTLTRLPPGATEIASEPASLIGPVMGTEPTSSMADHARFWQVPMSFSAAVAWVKAHPPKGLTFADSTYGSRDGSWSGREWRGYSYSAADSPAWIDAALEVGVASVTSSRSAIRADGVADWIDPAKDTAAGPRMWVSVAAGCPQSDIGKVGVRNTDGDLATMVLPVAVPSGGLICDYAGYNGTPFGLTSSTPLDQTAATQLASAATKSPLSHLDYDGVQCAAGDNSTSVLVFTYPGHADVDLWYDDNGCSTLSNGFITVFPSNALIELVGPTVFGSPFPSASASR